MRTVIRTEQPVIDDLWYKNAIVYSLDVDSFMDGNGDGVGDFQGLMRRLDYLESLGVDVLWLAPFQPSPNRDNGYDIKDYYGVDRRYGSSGDYVDFMHQARRRGLRVVIDLVVNHTSDRHPWFQAARRDPDSRHRDWYIWADKRPRNWNKGMVFPGVQKATWTRDPVAKAWYHHRFYDFQPDLNMDNPDVRAEIRRVMGYWLELGIDGFRVDAVPFVIETSSRAGPGSLRFEYLAEMREFLQWRAGSAVLLGEANVMPEETRKYFSTGHDALHMMFNFYVNQHLFYALACADVRPLAHALRATKRIPPMTQWAQFLRNHDELDLGRLSPEQQKVVFERFGPDPDMQLYDRGIRRRLASMLGDRAYIELAYSMLFSLPGTPVLRYGDEIGMGENLSLSERTAVRTPMQWTNEANAGFSTAKRLLEPVISSGPYGYQHVNVEAQRHDPNSLFNWTARMIRARKECPEIGWGDWTLLPSGSSSVIVLCFSWRGNRVVTLHNFSHEPTEVKVRLDGPDGGYLANLLGHEPSHNADDGAHHITLESYGYRWYRVGTPNYALDRSRRGRGAFRD